MGNVEKQPSGLFVPKRIPASHNSMRAMVAEASGKPYRSLPTLEAARAVEDGVVILQGDDGGTIYVVCPAARVLCEPRDLSCLLFDLDAVKWGQPDAVGLFYERYPVGAIVPGGMGGGLVTSDVWIYQVLVEKNLTTAIEDVIAGKSKSIMDTGISDLAHQHDYYLHGTPKRGTGEV